MSELRRRLDDLIRLPRSFLAACPPPRPRAGLAETLGGREVRLTSGAYWRVDTPIDSLRVGGCAYRPCPNAPPVRGIDPRRALVLDIETGGFAGAPVFLIGVLPLDDTPLRVVQYLARDYPEEESVLRGFAELAEHYDTWVTFNGKSFDEPFLRDRAIRHHIRLRPPSMHFDLLHAARRAWGAQVPNCRLVTLEEHVLGIRRTGDVPGGDVPDLFHHFIRTGNAGPLRAVLEHNRLDLATCLEMLVRLAASVS